MGDTAEMWGDMLGLGPILATLKDPQFFAQLNALFNGLIALDQRTMRMEATLNAIAERIGVDVGSIGIGPAVSAGNGAARDGSDAPATGAGHDGIGDAASTRLIA
jgi:hypothetical protein